MYITKQPTDHPEPTDNWAIVDAATQKRLSLLMDLRNQPAKKKAMDFSLIFMIFVYNLKDRDGTQIAKPTEIVPWEPDGTEFKSETF